MRIFSKALHEYVTDHRPQVIRYGTLVLIALLFVGNVIFWHGRSTLRVGLVTDISNCSGNDEVSPQQLTEKLTTFFAFAKERDTDFNVSLGNLVRYRSDDCEDNAQSDLTWTVALLNEGARFHYVLGLRDIESTVESYEQWNALMDRTQNYYAFDKKGVRVIVLDTVLGGDAMSEPCEKVASCKDHLHRWDFVRTLLKDESTLEDYLERNGTTRDALLEEREQERAIVKSERKVIKLTRSYGNRKIGRIGDAQLNWLRDELNRTGKKKILILSHHPLLPIPDGDDVDEIRDREAVAQVLRDSGKQIVAISARPDDWIDERDGAIHFYSVQSFQHEDGRWALFEWTRDGERFERVQN